MNELTVGETKTLAKCEEIIARGVGAFLEVGQALFDIREGRLYRATHETFEMYCSEKWDFKRSYANKLIRAAEVTCALGTIVPIVPTNEAQVRPLTALDPEEQAEVWQEVVESAPKAEDGTPIITAKLVEQVVQSRNEPEEDEEEDPFPEPDDDQEPPCDPFGNVWTDSAIADIHEAVAIKQDLGELNRINREWKKRSESRCGLTKNLDIVAMGKEVTFLKQRLKRLEPYCLCPMCDGDGCKLCLKNGWLTEEHYKLVPEEKRYRE